MWVKICGTTNLEDALAAVDAGADALGFVFAESPRRVELAVAADIVRSLPEGVEKVGVFVDETTERIREIADDVGLTTVQLHGRYDILGAANKFKVGTGSIRQLDVIPAYPARIFEDDVLVKFGIFDRALFDTATEGKQGGTGQTWDWELGKLVIETLRGHVRIVIAGGLTATNVADAIRTLRPWGVDVASGVEREPGRKDHKKVRAFVNAARSAAL